MQLMTKIPGIKATTSGAYNGSYIIENTLDGNTLTRYHSASNSSDVNTNFVIYNLGSVCDVGKISINGTIHDVDYQTGLDVAVSVDGVSYTPLPRFTNLSRAMVDYPINAKAQYIKLTNGTRSDTASNGYISFAEFEAYKNLTSIDISINPTHVQKLGSSVEFTLSNMATSVKTSPLTSYVSLGTGMYGESEVIKISDWKLIDKIEVIM